MGLWNWGKGKKSPQIRTLVEVDSDRVSCNGDGEHPRVWYTVPLKGFVVCGYCDMKYTRDESFKDIAIQYYDFTDAE